MANYTYVFGSLRDEKIIAEIPLYGVYMDLELNVGGSFTGTFNLDQTGKRNQDLLDATLPGKCFVAVERNGIVIWHGFIWARTYQSQAKSVQLNAQSFDMYPKYRLIRHDLTIDSTDQRNVFTQLWTHMQNSTLYPGGNLNINVPGTFTPTVVAKSMSVLASDFQTYAEVMSSVANTSDGFDWYIGTVKVNEQYVKTLAVGYPTLGAVYNSNSIIFEYPGAILNYYQTESMTDAGTHVYVIGSGEGDTMGVSFYEQPNMIAQGWPRWDKDVSRKDLLFPSTALATQEGIARRPPMQVFKPTIKGDKAPEFGSWALGDQVRLVVDDARNFNGLSVVNRIVKWTLTPPSSENTEEYGIILAGDDTG